jgi:hypothetical protein
MEKLVGRLQYTKASNCEMVVASLWPYFLTSVYADKRYALVIIIWDSLGVVKGHARSKIQM